MLEWILDSPWNGLMGLLNFAHVAIISVKCQTERTKLVSRTDQAKLSLVLRGQKKVVVIY
ncbi:hypothetical protein OG21DRAFT_1507838 [Imleria badia]|nr:hypothetical protein OG21DRAFT_1507838 [Imleria badia]